MYIACSSLCFGRYPLERALQSISELQFQKVDLAVHERGRHMRPSEVAADIGRAGQVLRASGMSFAAFHVEIDAPEADAFRHQFRCVCRLARMMTVPVVTLPAAPIGSDFQEEIRRLTMLCRVAEAEGVILGMETHGQQVTAQPAGALELCKKVPGLGLTLDPSHYLLGHHLSSFDEVYPYVRHVRLRDTSNDKLQVRIGQGQMEYGKIINQLTLEGYERALTVDVRDQPDPGYPIEPEARKLKYLLESMV